LSRLTWTGETGNSAEGYFNIKDAGVFVKGYFGAGMLHGNNLQDEDFPPFTAPYSSTNSEAKTGRLSYASLDLGYYFMDTGRAKLGPFVGYHFYHEQMNAYGCVQTAANPGICVPSFPNSILALTQVNNWYSARVGAAGEWTIMPNLTLSGDAAYLPYVKLKGSDFHWLRIGTDFDGPTPETGHGTGMQFEGVLSYNFNQYFSLGVGGRYWRMDAPHSTAHFEDSTLCCGPQVEKFQTNRYGAFVQVGLKY
jgi:outer membrane protease